MNELWPSRRELIGLAIMIAGWAALILAVPHDLAIAALTSAVGLALVVPLKWDDQA